MSSRESNEPFKTIATQYEETFYRPPYGVVDRVTPTEGETYAAWCGRVGESPDVCTPMSWAWTVDWGRGSWRPPRSATAVSADAFVAWQRVGAHDQVQADSSRRVLSHDHARRFDQVGLRSHPPDTERQPDDPESAARGAADQSQGHVAHVVREYLTNYARSYGSSTMREHPLCLQSASPIKSGYPDRSAVDAMLREDARLHPEFAEARRAAVMADFEVREGGPPRARSDEEHAIRLVRVLHRYESLRGGGREPLPHARRLGELDPAVAAYEAARSRGVRR